jgi:hypothetical protein
VTWSALNSMIWSAGASGAGVGAVAGAGEGAWAAFAAGAAAIIGSADHQANLVRNAARPAVRETKPALAYRTGRARRQSPARRFAKAKVAS